MINQMAYYTKKKNRGWNGCENYSDKDRKLVVHVQTEQKGMMMLPSPAYHRGVGRVRTSESLADPREGGGGGRVVVHRKGMHQQYYKLPPSPPPHLLQTLDTSATNIPQTRPSFLRSLNDDASD